MINYALHNITLYMTKYNLFIVFEKLSAHIYICQQQFIKLFNQKKKQFIKLKFYISKAC